ncbi:hypothetical protein AVEN_173618-1 [Araneus ventricosus]|uniref:Uncharacterized protein n=1 Tax=Araneus ventricosus TaxID=182803 RepID=A0A4Y2TMS8_ARAVE|nr:hypothetical protein AVEN_245761-1 [Araneus ventricosus]GBO00716.1 hypothetical protein AVEN_173618-1 [Araneus ventricosus]
MECRGAFRSKPFAWSGKLLKAGLRQVILDHFRPRKLDYSTPKPIVIVENQSELSLRGTEGWISNLSQYLSLHLDCRILTVGCVVDVGFRRRRQSEIGVTDSE